METFNGRSALLQELPWRRTKMLIEGKRALALAADIQVVGRIVVIILLAGRLHSLLLKRTHLEFRFKS